MRGGSQRPIITYVKLTFGPGVSSLQRSPTGCVTSHVVSRSETSMLVIRPGVYSRPDFRLASCGRTCTGTSVMI